MMLLVFQGNALHLYCDCFHDSQSPGYGYGNRAWTETPVAIFREVEMAGVWSLVRRSWGAGQRRLLGLHDESE